MSTESGEAHNSAILAGQYWRLLTAVFLHGGVAHILVNSYSLYVVGLQAERLYGSRRFLAIYLLSGLSGSILSFALSPYPSIGASGAIFGLVGALVPLLYRNRRILPSSRQGLMSIGRVILLNLFLGFVIPGIDYWAHIGGLLGGVALAWFATPIYKIMTDYDSSMKVVDDSPVGLAWASMALVGLVLVGITYLLIVFHIPPT